MISKYQKGWADYKPPYWAWLQKLADRISQLHKIINSGKSELREVQAEYRAQLGKVNEHYITEQEYADHDCHASKDDSCSVCTAYFIQKATADRIAQRVKVN